MSIHVTKNLAIAEARQFPNFKKYNFIILTFFQGVAQRAVYAVNCGGEAHVDVFGIRFARDANRVGTASDYGKQLMIARVPQQDQVSNLILQTLVE